MSHHKLQLSWVVRKLHDYRHRSRSYLVQYLPVWAFLDTVSLHAVGRHDLVHYHGEILLFGHHLALVYSLQLFLLILHVVEWRYVVN